MCCLCVVLVELQSLKVDFHLFFFSVGSRKNSGECPVDVFLFPWNNADRLPDKQAILDIFQVNPKLAFNVTYQSYEEKFGDGQEVEELFKCRRYVSEGIKFYDALPKVLDG